jgi:tetratricopeptide (TPR) repeat protein
VPRAGRLLIGLALGLLECRRAPSPPPVTGRTSLADEVLPLIAQGDTSGALARLQGADQTDGEVLYLEGLAWARKAETASAPEAGGSPAGGGHGGPRPSDLKPEEEQALSFLERAVAARPDLAAAHIALADLLGPHALRREAQGRALVATRSRGAHKVEAPAAFDSGVERVLLAYRRGAQADPTSKSVVEGWIDFARKAGRIEEANEGFQQLLLRDKENAAPFLRYGDFLLADRKDELGAIGAYAQALIWQPSLDEARVKIADIYLAQAAAHFERKEYASAEARLKDAGRYVGGAESSQRTRLRQLQSQLALVRGR